MNSIKELKKINTNSSKLFPEMENKKAIPNKLMKSILL